MVPRWNLALLRRMAGFLIRRASSGSWVRHRLPALVPTLALVSAVSPVVALAGTPRAGWTSPPVIWLRGSSPDQVGAWSLRAYGLRGDLLRLLASRCRLAVLVHQAQDQEIGGDPVGIAVEGRSSCREVVQLVLDAPPLPTTSDLVVMP